MEIIINGNEIILQKYEPKCIFCEGKNEVIERLGKHICKKCINEI